MDDDATVESREVRYERAGQTHHGYLASPAAKGDAAPVPGVLILHDFRGQSDFHREQARRLAALGYVALAADLYGDGRTAADHQEAGQWARQLGGDRAAFREAGAEALRTLAAQPGVDPGRLAVMGYCFGGTGAVELAYAAPQGLRAAVSFHGSPKPPEAGDTPTVPLLILHGAADHVVSNEQVSEVSAALTAAGADWTVVTYAGAKHGFTSPGAWTADAPTGDANRRAGERSWGHMRLFLEERLAPGA